MKEENTPTAGLQVETHNGFKKGDIVITHFFDDSPDLRFLKDMLLCMDKPGEITYIDDTIVSVNNWAWPITAIEHYTPASISEQKQEGETENPLLALVERCKEKHGNGVYDIADCVVRGYQLGQSQNTAKQIDQYKARIFALEAEILTPKNK